MASSGGKHVNLRRYGPSGIIVRVAALNNFGHTQREIEDLERIIGENERYAGFKRGQLKCFINTNAKDELRYDKMPIVVTLNPDLERFVEPRGKAVHKVVAGRVKWVPGAMPEVEEAFLASLRWCRDHNVTALITKMRFHRTDIMYRYCMTPWKSYGRRVSPLCGRAFGELKPYEPGGHSGFDKRAYARAVGMKPGLIRVCNEKNSGCQACHHCSRLTYTNAVPIASLNLSASRPDINDMSKLAYLHCKHDCPECFAGSTCNQSGGEPEYDVIKQNSKQAEKAQAEDVIGDIGGANEGVPIDEVLEAIERLRYMCDEGIYAKTTSKATRKKAGQPITKDNVRQAYCDGAELLQQLVDDAREAGMSRVFMPIVPVGLNKEHLGLLVKRNSGLIGDEGVDDEFVEGIEDDKMADKAARLLAATPTDPRARWYGDPPSTSIYFPGKLTKGFGVVRGCASLLAQRVPEVADLLKAIGPMSYFSNDDKHVIPVVGEARRVVARSLTAAGLMKAVRLAVGGMSWRNIFEEEIGAEDWCPLPVKDRSTGRYPSPYEDLEEDELGDVMHEAAAIYKELVERGAK